MNLNRLSYFAAVVDAGSFTQAGERLGVTKAVVSQQVAQLEQELRTSLLVRTTRRVQPTEAGRLFHARCVMILREAEDAFAEIAGAAREPVGTLRLTAPHDYGAAVVMPVIAAFVARYPGCRVEQTLGDQTIDLVSSGIDLAIRVGWLADSSLQARRIGAFRQMLVASPALGGRITGLREPADLASLPFIANSALREPLSWQFLRDQQRQTVRFQATVAIDTTPGVLAAVRLGAGLSVLPDFLIEEDVASGRLVPVLPAWELPSGGIHTVYPAARFRPPKVSAFVEMLVAAVQGKVAPRAAPGQYG